MGKYITYNKEGMTSGTFFLDMLQLLFIALKLMGYIEWSWWRVLTPLIIWACMVGGAIAVVFIAAAHDEYVWRKRSKR